LGGTQRIRDQRRKLAASRDESRLWPVERNAHASLSGQTAQLLAVAEAAGDGMILFG